MRLYSGTTQEFLLDVVQNRIADKLRDAFFLYYRRQVSPGEVNSWKNSLRALSQVFQFAKLEDHGVMLEYELPLTSKRLDALVCGRNKSGSDEAVIIELKQWESCEGTDTENEVLTWIGGAHREVAHPCVQARQYRQYLVDGHTAFHEGAHPVYVTSCAYLHNYHLVPQDALLSEKFEQVMELCPLFTADDFTKLSDYLAQQLVSGEGSEVMRRIEASKYRPSKKLMEHVGAVIADKPEYTLLDEQLVIFDRVMASARATLDGAGKTAILIKGGPGTGKSVIAMNLLGRLNALGYNAQYATGSKAFTETLRKIVGTRAAAQFRYFNSYMTAAPGDVDVLVCDEAHRLRRNSNSMYTPAAHRTGRPQVQELIDVARVCVFFIDDDQVVRSDEVGSYDVIKKAVEAAGCRVYEYELEAQFRCGGSDGFVNWVNNTLGVRRTANVIWNQNEEFNFRIVDSPQELERMIREKAGDGFLARMVAGFCWPWSKPDKNGELVNDIVIGDFRRPWNARSGAGKLAKGIPKESLWAYSPAGINQIGCIYTAQGFEFDYVGVIFGKDLVYNPTSGDWRAQKEFSCDNNIKRSGDEMVRYLKNVYRVLLTRGMKGCLVYFMDEDTRNFFKSRME